MVSHSVTKVGIELLAALKSNSFFREQEPGEGCHISQIFHLPFICLHDMCAENSLRGGV